MKKLFLLLLLFMTARSGFAQLPNEVFYDSLSTGEEGELQLGLRVLGYIRNTEYFNDYQAGATLFGLHVLPTVHYTAGSGISLHAGAFVRQDFGSGGIQWVQPIFTIRYDKGRFSMLFGSIEGALRHGLAEPLYDFDNLIRRRIEQGAQFKWKSTRLSAEAWIEWQQATYQGSQSKEAFWAGSTGAFAFIKSKSWVAEAAWQITAYHVGGQLDTMNQPTITQMNLSPILRIIHNSETFQWKAEYQYLHQQSTGSFEAIPTGLGQGHLASLSMKRKGLCLMANYWQTEGFYSLQGGSVYQSFSSIDPNTPIVSPKRELIWLRVLADIPLSASTSLTLRAEPFLDLATGLVEYSYGFYINSRIIQRLRLK